MTQMLQPSSQRLANLPPIALPRSITLSSILTGDAGTRAEAPPRRARAVPFNPETLHLPAEFGQRPMLAPLLTWLKLFHRGSLNTRSYKQRSAQRAEAPSSLQSLGRQIVQVLDIQPFTVEVGPAEAFLYAEMGQECDGLRLVCHPQLVEHNRSEQRFMFMRAVYAHFQRHTALTILIQNWTEESRDHLLRLFFSWNQRHAKPILNEDWARRQGQPRNLARLSHWLNQLYQKYQYPALHDLRELLVRTNPFRRELDLEADVFATTACGQETAGAMLPLLYSQDTASDQLAAVDERMQSLQEELL